MPWLSFIFQLGQSVTTICPRSIPKGIRLQKAANTTQNTIALVLIIPLLTSGLWGLRLACTSFCLC